MTRTSLLVFTIISLLSLPALAQMEPSMPSLSNDQVNRLNAGEVLIAVVEGATPIGDAMGVIPHPPAAVLAVITDFATHSSFMDDISLSEVVGTDGDFSRCHGITDTPWPMDDREWTIRAGGSAAEVEGVPVMLATWSYVPGSGNIENTTGYWLMIPWGDDGQSTLLRYRIQVDLGTWLPDFLMTWATENFLPTKVTAIRDRVAALAQ